MELGEMGHIYTLRINHSDRSEAREFTDPKEAGSAFYEADACLRPVVTQSQEDRDAHGGRFARVIADTNVYTTYHEDGQIKEQQFVKALPTARSHEADSHFIAGYKHAQLSSSLEDNGMKNAGDVGRACPPSLREMNEACRFARTEALKEALREPGLRDQRWRVDRTPYVIVHGPNGERLLENGTVQWDRRRSTIVGLLKDYPAAQEIVVDGGFNFSPNKQAMDNGDYESIMWSATIWDLDAPSPEDAAELLKLLRSRTAFNSFEAMFENNGDYRPSMDVSDPDMLKLANYYDQLSEQRGDDRRAYRYGQHRLMPERQAGPEAWEPTTVLNLDRARELCDLADIRVTQLFEDSARWEWFDDDSGTRGETSFPSEGAAMEEAIRSRYVQDSAGQAAAGTTFAELLTYAEQQQREVSEARP